MMTKQFILLATVALIVQHSPVRAETLPEVLARTYNTNPAFQAQYAAVKAAHERIPEARAGWFPNVSADGQAGIQNDETVGGLFARKETRNPRSVGISLNQPLYSGGRTTSAVSKAEFEALAQEALFRSSEQALLRSAAVAYIDVMRAQTILDLNRNNAEVLERQLNAVQARFDAGDVTITDISQAKARLAGAVARKTQAEGLLTAAKTTFTRITGDKPENLARPEFPTNLPQTLEAAISAARSDNPDLLASILVEKAAQQGIDLAEGALLPSLDMQAGVSHSEETSFRDSETDLASATLRLTIPLYQGGAEHARVRQAKELHNQRRLESRDFIRKVEEGTVQNWEALKTSLANIKSLEAQVEAAASALSGVKDEEDAGTRTILDVLNSEQELLDSKVALEGAKRDAFVASLDLQTAIGSLSAEKLELSVKPYDVKGHLKKTRNKMFGTKTVLTE